jgi:AmmeMemoRadiSam system protein A
MTIFDHDDRRTLLALGRASIAARLAGQAPPPVPPLDRLGGAFVTLHQAGDLRGCIGYPEADQRLAEVVRRCAVSAAFEDPRFPPLTGVEFPDVRLEISALGPMTPVHRHTDVALGRHGVMVRQGRHRGLLLPQVAVEWGFTLEEFLAQVCVKAGLPPDAWGRGAELCVFEAEVFAEDRRSSLLASAPLRRL